MLWSVNAGLEVTLTLSSDVKPFIANSRAHSLS